MNQFKLTTRKAGTLAVCLGMGLALAPGWSQADIEPDAYNMLVVSNQAYGGALLAGDYDSAIEKITTANKRRLDRFAASNNLCVAYVRAQEAEKARSACKRAVDRSRLATRRDQAIALSNLGVVRALTGDDEGALHSFQAAIRLKPELKAPAENLERLFSKS